MQQPTQQHQRSPQQGYGLCWSITHYKQRLRTEICRDLKIISYTAATTPGLWAVEVALLCIDPIQAAPHRLQPSALPSCLQGADATGL